MKKLYLTLFLVILAITFAGFIYWRFFFISSFNIDPVPSNATVSINGQTTPDRSIQLAKGDYTVTVSAPGYRSQSFTVSVGYGSQVNKRVELEQLPKPKQVLEGPIESLQPTPNRQEIFFKRSGVFYRFPLVSDRPIPAVPITPTLTDVETATWSPDFALALLRKTNGETGLYDFNRYDLLHQEYRSLGLGINSPVWLADGSGFYYEEVKDGQRSLMRANRAGTGSTRIMNLTNFPMSDLQIQLGSGTLLVISSKKANEPTSTEKTDIVLLDTHQQTVGAITESGRASHPVLSPNKSLIAYLDSGELVTSEITGKNKRNYNLRPKAGSYLFIDEVNVAVFTPNLVTVVNTHNGSRQTYEIYAPSDEIGNLFADPSGKIIYYTFGGNLYQINFRP